MLWKRDQVQRHASVGSVFENAEEVAELRVLRSLDQIEDQTLESGHVAPRVSERLHADVAVRGYHGRRGIDDYEDCVAKLEQVKRSLLHANMGVTAVQDGLLAFGGKAFKMRPDSLVEH